MEKSIKPFVLEYTLISREDEKRLNCVLLTPNNRMAIIFFFQKMSFDRKQYSDKRTFDWYLQFTQNDYKLIRRFVLHTFTFEENGFFTLAKNSYFPVRARQPPKTNSYCKSFDSHDAYSQKLIRNAYDISFIMSLQIGEKAKTAVGIETTFRIDDFFRGHFQSHAMRTESFRFPFPDSVFLNCYIHFLNHCILELFPQF